MKVRIGGSTEVNSPSDKGLGDPFVSSLNLSTYENTVSNPQTITALVKHTHSLTPVSLEAVLGRGQLCESYCKACCSLLRSSGLPYLIASAGKQVNPTV